MRGQVWVEAVLYIAIGVVAISLILGAGLPVIYRMRDRNTVIQTKELLHTFDDAIRQVVSEGLGSQRVLDPVIIKGGKLNIKDGEDIISWQMDTTAEIMEPCDLEAGDCDDLTQSEGNIEMYLAKTYVEKEYVINLNLEYENIDIQFDEDSLAGSLMGKYVILVRNDGVLPDKKKTIVSLKVS